MEAKRDALIQANAAQRRELVSLYAAEVSRISVTIRDSVRVTAAACLRGAMYTTLACGLVEPFGGFRLHSHETLQCSSVELQATPDDDRPVVHE